MSSISTSQKRKRINDPVHGAVFLTPLEYKIATSPAFVRLANVKQLGLGAFVFPGATYSRQEHSMGACHVAGQMLASISHSGVDISDHDYHITRLAALLHDLGHYPFSHATEEAVHLIEGVPALEGSPPTQEYFTDHEEVGKYIIKNDPHISSLLREHGFTADEIVARLDGADNTSLNMLVSSDLDCDRLDYLRRTSLHAGLPYGGVDAEYLIDNLTLDVDGLPCLHSKAIGAADHFLVSRLYDFEQVPFHKAVVGYEEALKKTLAAMMRDGALDLSRRAVAGMVADETWRRFDDQTMMGKIRVFKDEISASSPSDQVIPFVDCILNRRAPKLVLDFQYLDRQSEESEEKFDNLAAECSDLATATYWEFGVDPELTFTWSRSFPMLKGSESGQRIRLLSYGDRSQRSWPIDLAARTLSSKLDGVVLRHFRLYACLNGFPDPKDLRAKIRSRLSSHVDARGLEFDLLEDQD
ncbi:HD domain-containing protein [Devosia sp.]|uniref:HD domain-containing protein n=1 Tax=Devosia sp. TaxID=1871048 RepID=UPI002737546A|nr:HD domain-containing protein [Devosia sp.]MDP2781585.1 HD domain-containing protein [Devosia sp.]